MVTRGYKWKNCPPEVEELGKVRYYYLMKLQSNDDDLEHQM